MGSRDHIPRPAAVAEITRLGALPPLRSRPAGRPVRVPPASRSDLIRPGPWYPGVELISSVREREHHLATPLHPLDARIRGERACVGDRAGLSIAVDHSTTYPRPGKSQTAEQTPAGLSPSLFTAGLVLRCRGQLPVEIAGQTRRAALHQVEVHLITSALGRRLAES